MSFSKYPKNPSMFVCDAVIAPTTPDDCTTIKVPILLQKFSIKIPLHVTVIFPEDENVLDIFQIKKNVFITKCHLALPKVREIAGNLYLSGIVRKTIQYAFNLNVFCDKENSINSTTIEIPFECVVRLDCFRNPPIGSFPDTDKKLEVMAKNKTSPEKCNGHPFCEIVWSDFIDIDKEIKHKCHTEPIYFERECRVVKCIKCQEPKSKRHYDNRRKFQRESLFNLKESTESFQKKTQIKCETCSKCLCRTCSKSQLLKKYTIKSLSKKMVLDLTLKLIQEQNIIIE